MRHAIVAGLSVSTGMLCILIAVLLRTVGSNRWPHAQVALVLTGTVAILGTTIGVHLHEWVMKLDHLLGSVTGPLFGAAVAGLVAIVAAVVVIFGVWDNQIDDRTYIATVVMALAANSIPGPTGGIIVTAMSGIASAVGSLVGWAFGL